MAKVCPCILFASEASWLSPQVRVFWIAFSPNSSWALDKEPKCLPQDSGFFCKGDYLKVWHAAQALNWIQHCNLFHNRMTQQNYLQHSMKANAKVKVCINYLVKPEKIQTFLSDLSRAAYLNFRRMGRGFSLSLLFLSLEKYFKYLFSLFWDKAVTKNWRAGFWASVYKRKENAVEILSTPTSSRTYEFSHQSR